MYIDMNDHPMHWDTHCRLAVMLYTIPESYTVRAFAAAGASEPLDFRPQDVLLGLCGLFKELIVMVVDLPELLLCLGKLQLCFRYSLQEFKISATWSH